MKLDEKKIDALIEKAEDRLDTLEKDKQRTIGEIGAYQALKELIDESGDEPEEIPLDPDKDFQEHTNKYDYHQATAKPTNPLEKKEKKIKRFTFFNAILLLLGLIAAILILIWAVQGGLI